VKTKFDIEDIPDPWGGNIKMFRVQHDITGEVFGETNSSYVVEELCNEHPGSKRINQWSEKTTELLFHRDKYIET
jgi:hypothetical protein